MSYQDKEELFQEDNLLISSIKNKTISNFASSKNETISNFATSLKSRATQNFNSKDGKYAGFDVAKEKGFL